VGVYKYIGAAADRDQVDSGTVLASSEEDAREKLRKYRYEKVKLKKLAGQTAYLASFAADVK
jgi:type II secretory pathway component PulF